MSGSCLPEVDVFIPVYNDVEFVAQAVSSCLMQEQVDVRLLVSDNCSTDGTSELLREMAEADSRIVLSRNSTNLGLAGNMQRVHELVTRPYYMFLCSDDCLIDKNAFRDALALFEAFPDVTSVYSNIDFIDRDGRLIARNKFHRSTTFSARKTLQKSLISTRNRFGIPLMHRTEISARYRYRDDLVYSNDLWHSYKVGMHGMCGHVDRACIGNRYTGDNLTVELMGSALNELKRIEKAEEVSFNSLDRILQFGNHIKTVAAKMFFFKILIPLKSFLR